MLVLHHLSNHPLLELSATMFRWITCLGLFQTAALSFTMMSTPTIKNSRRRTVLQERQHSSSWKDIGAPWKKEAERDEHVMEDVFLDEGYAQDLDDEDYHHFVEGGGELRFDEVVEVLLKNEDKQQHLVDDEDELNTRGPLAP
jgi:hypothetical protein